MENKYKRMLEMQRKRWAEWGAEDAAEFDRLMWLSPEEDAAETAAREAELMTPGYCTESWLKMYYDECGPTEAFKAWYEARRLPLE